MLRIISSHLNLTKGVLPFFFFIFLSHIFDTKYNQSCDRLGLNNFLSCLFALIIINSIPVTKLLTDRHELGVNFYFFYVKGVRAFKFVFQ